MAAVNISSTGFKEWLSLKMGAFVNELEVEVKVKEIIGVLSGDYQFVDDTSATIRDILRRLMVSNH